MAPAGVAMNAIGRESSPASSNTLLKKPRPGNASNIHRHVSAMMTVEVIQGSSIRPRKKFRHRQVACSTRAMAFVRDLERHRADGEDEAVAHDGVEAVVVDQVKVVRSEEHT